MDPRAAVAAVSGSVGPSGLLLTGADIFGNITPNMSNSSLSALSAAVVRILRPLVRILLRNGMPYGAFADLAEQAYVDIAMAEFGVEGRKQTVSRVSVITGLSRKEVARVLKLPVSDDAGAAERYNRAARVIAAWVRDRRFNNESGKPLVLPVEGDGASFKELVMKYSGDIPHRAILDELTRVGAVERLEDGRLRLCVRSYVPRTGELEKLGILGTDVAALIATVDHNLRGGTEDSMFQRKVAYDNLPDQALAVFRELSGEQAQALLEEWDRWLAEHDRDVNPSVEGSGRNRAGIGIYYFEEPYDGKE